MRRALAAAGGALLLAAPGRAPAQAPGQLFRAVDSVVGAGIAEGVYPGAVVLVGRRDTVLHARGYGRFTWDAASPVPDPDRTPWDLASLTKVVATTPAVLRLAARGVLDLDAPVARYLPPFSGGGRELVTLRRLLDHTSGLRPGLPLSRLARSRDEAIALVLAEVPLDPPGAVVRYSDLNAILLGLVVEAVSGESLDRVAAREVFAPLGMLHTGFGLPAADRWLAPPGGAERGTVLQGVPQDPSARRMGGVAGHAGLFGTGRDLARYAQVWLARGTGGPRLVGTEWMDRVLVRDTLPGARYLGWDRPEPLEGRPSSFGTLAGPAAFGHTGWTGTQVWLDPDRDLFVVFLTNRSWAGGRRGSLERMRDLRGALADAVVRATSPCAVAAATRTC